MKNLLIILFTLLLIACNRFEPIVHRIYDSDTHFVLVNNSQHFMGLKAFNASGFLLKEFVISEGDSLVLSWRDWGVNDLLSFGDDNKEVSDSLVLEFDSVRYLPLIRSQSAIYDYSCYEQDNFEKGDSLMVLYYYTFTEEDYDASMPL